MDRPALDRVQQLLPLAKAELQMNAQKYRRFIEHLERLELCVESGGDFVSVAQAALSVVPDELHSYKGVRPAKDNLGRSRELVTEINKIVKWDKQKKRA